MLPNINYLIIEVRVVMNICVYGSGSKDTDKKYLYMGFKLGQRLADESYSVVFGGGTHGMMGAVARGAIDRNGHLIGISPRWLNNVEPIYDDCSEFIHVDTLDERKNKFVEYSDVFIVTPGGIGTMDEFFEVITLRKLERINHEVIIFNIDHFYDDMINFIKKMDEEHLLNIEIQSIFRVATDIEGIFEIFEEMEK